MANCLRMAQVQAILVLRARGWSFRRIGRELGIHRDTVRRHVQLAESSGGDPSVESDVQNRPNLPAGSGPTSTAEPYREAIAQGLERGLSCQRIWQDLKTEHGFAGSYDSVITFPKELDALCTDSSPAPGRAVKFWDWYHFISGFLHCQHLM